MRIINQDDWVSECEAYITNCRGSTRLFNLFFYCFVVKDNGEFACEQKQAKLKEYHLM